MTTPMEMLAEVNCEFESLKHALLKDGGSWLPWQQTQFQVLVEEVMRKKQSAMALMHQESFYLSAPDPEPQVTGQCPFCGNWYRGDETKCLDGCGGALIPVIRVSLKPQRRTYSTERR